MKPHGSSDAAHKGLGTQTSGHPSVKNMAPAPNTKIVTQTTHSKMPPSKGSWSHGVQSGSTSPMTDAGGGLGNDASSNHRKLIGK